MADTAQLFLTLACLASIRMQCYYDNRYWTMWKLPMFGCSDPSQVLTEIQKCSKAFPECYQRLVAFDNRRWAVGLSVFKAVCLRESIGLSFPAYQILAENQSVGSHLVLSSQVHWQARSSPGWCGDCTEHYTLHLCDFT